MGGREDVTSRAADGGPERFVADGGPERFGADGGLEEVGSWPADASAAGVVRRLRSDAGDDLGPPEIVARAGNGEVVFPWASVTKLLVTMAVMVATEEGILGLDDPAGPPGSTVRHLMAHAAGLGPDGREPITLPGRRRIYSNAGFEVLAEVLADRAAMEFEAYLRAGVLEPLSMTETALASGTSPAWGATGPLDDLLRLAAEFLEPRLVAAETLHGATSVAFPGLAGVLPGFGRFEPCDWGLGFEVRDAKSPHWTGTRNSPSTFGHFGQTGGFVWVDPVAGLACAALSNLAFGPWAVEAWPRLSDAVLGRWAPVAPD